MVMKFSLRTPISRFHFVRSYFKNVLVVEIDLIFSISLVEKAGPELHTLTICQYLMHHLQKDVYVVLILFYCTVMFSRPQTNS